MPWILRQSGPVAAPYFDFRVFGVWTLGHASAGGWWRRGGCPLLQSLVQVCLHAGGCFGAVSGDSFCDAQELHEEVNPHQGGLFGDP